MASLSPWKRFTSVTDDLLHVPLHPRGIFQSFHGRPLLFSLASVTRVLFFPIQKFHCWFLLFLLISTVSSSSSLLAFPQWTNFFIILFLGITTNTHILWTPGVQWHLKTNMAKDELIFSLNQGISSQEFSPWSTQTGILGATVTVTTPMLHN